MWNKIENIIQAAKWLKRHIELIEEKERLLAAQLIADTNTPIRTIYRSGIYFAELGEGNIGGEKNKTRPVLVMSTNKLNKGDTVVIAPLSTKFKVKPNGLPLYNNHYLLKKSIYPQLDADSVVKFEDIRSIDIIRIGGFICDVCKTDMKRMERSIKFMLGY